MSARRIDKVITARSQAEGQGVTVRRSIGSPGLSVFDPFLLLDEFVIAGDAKGAGFPDHPHRGFETVTYMLSGRMTHADSAGNGGTIGPGAAQWMTAGRGVVHSEIPESDGEEIRGLQLWVNLAAAEKMKPPAYQDIEAEAIPEIALPSGGAVRVIAGTFQGVTGPVAGIASKPLYLDIDLRGEGEVTVPLPEGHNAFVYVLSGEIRAGAEEQALGAGQLGLLGPGDAITLNGGPARLILVAAQPFAEPVARHGPFVMNSRAEIEQAISDYQAGRF